jgi:hypothetical protein
VIVDVGVIVIVSVSVSVSVDGDGDGDGDGDVNVNDPAHDLSVAVFQAHASPLALPPNGHPCARYVLLPMYPV